MMKLSQILNKDLKNVNTGTEFFFLFSPSLINSQIFYTNGHSRDSLSTSPYDSSKKIQFGVKRALASQEVTQGRWAVFGIKAGRALPKGLPHPGLCLHGTLRILSSASDS